MMKWKQPKDPFALKLFEKNENESDGKNSFVGQIESYDAYNIILDRNTKKNEEELNVMKKYDILEDENILEEEDNQRVREKIKEHVSSMNGTSTKSSNLRIRSGNSNMGIKNLKIQTANVQAKKQEPVEAEEFKNFLASKKQHMTQQVAYDYSEHL